MIAYATFKQDMKTTKWCVVYQRTASCGGENLGKFQSITHAMEAACHRAEKDGAADLIYLDADGKKMY